MKFRVFDPDGVRMLIEAEELFLLNKEGRARIIPYLMNDGPGAARPVSLLDSRCYIYDENGRLLFNPCDTNIYRKLSRKNRLWVGGHAEWRENRMIWRRPYELIIEVRDES